MVVTDPRDAHQPLTEAAVHFISSKTSALQSTPCLILVQLLAPFFWLTFE